MMRNAFIFPCICFSLALGFVSCVPPETVTYTTAEPDYSDPVTLQILDYQDRQVSDSLLYFMGHENPAYRYLASMAFASYHDEAAVDSLVNRLEDSFEKVRYAAAYALGQIGSARAEPFLIDAFRQYDSLSVNTGSNAAILEAIGKCGSENSLENLATVASYEPSDTALLLGQARGIYRFALRNIVTQAGTDRMVELLSDAQIPLEVKVLAANYLYRTQPLDLSGYTERLITAFSEAEDPRVRMCLAVALGKTKDSRALTVMADALRSDTDYRVRCNVIKGFESFTYVQVEDIIYAALRDENNHVTQLAARYLVDHGNQQDALYYRSLSRGQYHWTVKAILYEAANRHLPGYFAITKANMQNELFSFYQGTDNPYEKGMLLKAIAREPKNFEDIWQKAREAQSTALQTQAMEALQQIALDPDLKTHYGTSALERRRKTFFDVFLEAIQSDNPSWIDIAAGTINDPRAGLLGYAKQSVHVLDSVYQSLELPRQIEVYNTLGECIAKIREQRFEPVAPAFNHPVDWSLFKSLQDTIAIDIVSSRGTMTIDLYKKSAPGTVVNFVQLVRDGFYTDKTVHRVVPNFVIQDGCPRGDGYGSLDYSIRSELPPVYYMAEGMVGMASAGNHTECTQWFITHSPTPHLDGRYTLFGRVTGGMDILHSIQLGDTIDRIQIVNDIL